MRESQWSEDDSKVRGDSIDEPSSDKACACHHYRDPVLGDIQPLPTGPPATQRYQPPDLRYDHRGRVLKSSFLQNYAGPQPGAYATQGRVPFHPATNSRESGIPNESGLGLDLEDPSSHESRESNRNPIVLEANVEQAKPNPEARPTTRECHKKRMIHMIGIVALMCVVGLATITPLVVLRSTEDDALEDDPTSHSVYRPGAQEEDIIDLTLVPNMSNSTIEAIVGDPFSKQARAYEWISRDPNWNSFPGWRKQQRFAVACYSYFLTRKPNAPVHRFFVLKYDTHECDWMHGFEACGPERKSLKLEEEGRITHLGIPKRNLVDILGTIPAEIGFLSHLERITMTDIQVDHIEKVLQPEILQSFPLLKELKLHDCDLMGTIPSTLGLLTSLTSLDLGNNRWSGTVPKEIGSLSSLSTLNLMGNHALEALLPLGLCSQDHPPWVSLQTDWCQSATECCINT